MATTQEGQHTSYHALTTSVDPGPYQEAMMLASEDAHSGAGTANERLLMLINGILIASHTNLNDAMAAMAADKGATNFSSTADIS